MILLIALLLFQVPGWFDPASCPELYWRISYQGPCKTRKDLDKVIAVHKQWVESSGREGKPADLHGAILSNDDLSNVDFWGADFSGTILDGANLSGVILGPIRLMKERSSAAGPGAWTLQPPMFTAIRTGGRIVNAFPRPTDLSHSRAVGVDFRDADLSYSELESAEFSGSDFTNADLTGANLSGASLVHTRLDRTNMRNANLQGAILEPSSVDGMVGLEFSKNLETVTFATSPSGLIQLRKQMFDQGFKEQERELTYALNVAEAARDPLIERSLKKVAFEMTCQYGMNPGRCLRLVILLWIVFAIVFYFAMNEPGWMFLRVTRHVGSTDKTRELPMWHKVESRSTGLKRLLAQIRFEWRAIRASLFFSLVNAFSIGYRDFSIGRWLLLLSKREYEIRPAKWARTLAGIQSLLSVYLFALWLLTYFGRPFE